MSGAISATVAVVAIGFAVESAVTVGLTLATVLAATAAVGATLAAVGAITGDKTLQTVGMVVGAVGGIGALANSAGMFASSGLAAEIAAGTTAAETASPFATAGIDAEIAGWSNYGAGVTSPAAGGGATFSAPDVSASQPVTFDGVAQDAGISDYQTNQLTGGQNAGVGDSVSPLAFEPQTVSTNPVTDSVANSRPPLDTGTSLINETPASAVQAGATPQAPTAAAPQATVAPTAAPAAAPSAPVTGANTGMINGGLSFESVASNPGTAGITRTTGSGGLSGIMDFMNKNPVMTMGTLQAASSFFAGAFGGADADPARSAAYEAQAAQNQAAANLANRQLANMSSPLPSASGGGQITVRPPTGLINQNRVTGVPA